MKFFVIASLIIHVVLLNNASIFAKTFSFVEVIVTKSVVLINPFEDSTPLYSIKQGDLFPFIKKQNNYINIYVEGAKHGWVKASAVSIKEFDIVPTPSIAEKLNAVSRPYYNYSGQENYRFPSRSSNQNFDINSDGFVEVKASGRQYSPNDIESPLWPTIINDPVYKKIPRDVLLGPMDIDTRSRISLEGKLSEDLYVYYDIEQEPEMPGKYDVEIKYQDHHLQFFHLDANYKQGPYINVQKSLRGAQYRYDDSYNLFQLSMGKERSESHKLESFGSGSKLIKLTHKYIYPGSVRVYINNSRKEENQHYTVDYYNGTVLFEFPIEKTDYYKIIYEVSNPIADYLPVLARRNFQAIQYSGSSRSIESHSLITLSQTDAFIYKPELPPIQFPTFNTSIIDTIVSNNKLLSLNPMTMLVDMGILNSDYTLLNYISTINSVSLFELSIASSDIALIVDELDHLFVETALFKESLLEQYSDVQIFPDSFLNLEGMTLKDSLDIFYALVDVKVLNGQGYIISNLLSQSSIFDDSSLFYYYNDIILTWLKSFYLETKQSIRPRFILSKNPVELGSVSIQLNDVSLQLNKDFIVDYSLGVISFLIPLQQQDAIDIAYNYYIRESHVNEFIGKNITGPYQLSNFPILDGTAKVTLDDTLLQELDDFIIDYDNGEIFFNFDVSHPSIITVHYDFIQKQVVTKVSKERPFDISATYINEFVPADDQVQIMSIVSENVAIVDSIISLANTPLTNTENIIISVDGTLITSQNFVVTSNYKGDIQLINTPSYPSLASGSKAIISYDYLKSYRTKDSITPKTSATQTIPYKIDGVEYIIDYLPVKYDGVHYITYQGTKLQEESFDVEYLNDGLGLIITFYISSVKPGSKLETYPNGPFTIHFDYTPQELSAMDDIRHHMLGTTIKGNLSDSFSIVGDFAFTENNFGGQLIDFEMPDRQGNGIDNYFYDLGKTNLVENSEQVFLNGQSQTRDVDYIIIYKNGKFRFINKTPSVTDTISADFQYSEEKGVLQTNTKQTGYATQFLAEYDVPSFNAVSSFKYINPEFAPIGSINEQTGNSIFQSGITWAVSPGLSFSSNYSRGKQIALVNAQSEPIYTHTDIFSTTMKNRYFNAIDASHGFDYRFSLQDPDAAYDNDFSHDVDDLTVSYKGSFSFGPSFLKSTIHRSFSRQNIDYIDKLAPKTISSKSSSYTSNLNLSDSFFFRSITIKPSYYQSYSNTIESKAPTSSFKEHRNFDLTSSFSPFKSWSFTPMYKWSNTQQQPSSEADIAENKAMSYGIGSKYEPVTWFSTYVSYHHKEDESVLLNQQSNISNSKQASLKRFTPYFALLSLGLSPNNYLATILQNSTLSYSYSENNNQKNDRRSLSNSYSNRANLTQLTLIPTLRIHNLSYSHSNTKNDSYVESLSVSENHSLSYSSAYQGQLSFRPSWFVLKFINYSTSIKHSFLSSSSQAMARSVTGNETEQLTAEDTLSHSFTFSPPQFSLPNIFNPRKRFRLGKVSLSLSLNNFQKDYTQASYPYIFEPSLDTFSRLASTSESMDQEDSQTSVISSTASPFNLINMNGSLTQKESYFNRNTFSNSQSLFQEIKNYESSHSISPFRFLTFSLQANQNRSSQWDFPSTNITVNELIITNNVALSFTNKWSRFYQFSSTLKPFRFVSLTGAASHNFIRQHRGPITSLDMSTFTTETVSTTLGIYPIKSLAISGTYSKNRINSNDSNFNLGESNSQTLSYTPVKTTYASISINYTRQQTNGWGINSLELDNQELADSTIGETKKVDRDYITQTGSLNVDISFPINNAYVQKFTLEGEGYIKDIKDFLETPENPLSYSISGLVLKGTLHL